MINKLLQANADSRRRKLYIRTYGVVTLNEECGLIEWVPNTIGLRHILSALYKTHHKTLYVRPFCPGQDPGTDEYALWQSNEIKGLFDSIRAKPRRAAEIFTQNVLPLYGCLPFCACFGATLTVLLGTHLSFTSGSSLHSPSRRPGLAPD